MPHVDVNPPVPLVAKCNVFEIENAACPRCDGPLWFARRRRDFVCPACVRVPVPYCLPVATPSTPKRGAR